MLFKQFYSFQRKGLFRFEPSWKILPVDHINFGAVSIAGSTAIIVGTAGRRIVGHYIECYDIRYHIDFDVVMVPVSAFRPAFVIYMPEYQNAPVIPYRLLAMEKPAHCGVQHGSDVIGGSL